MNDIFNFKRFGKYLLTDIKSCFAAYGTSFLTIMLSGVIIYAVSVIYSLILGNGWHGSELGLRGTIAGISFFVLTITYPSRCYGRITEKRAGSSWLMTPVSIYEKLLSMFLITCVLIPTVFILIYAGVDFLLCLADHTCGKPLVSVVSDMNFQIKGIMHKLDPITTAFIVPPLYIINDTINSILIFLLGALVFKKGKISKTILSVIALSIISAIVPISFIKNFLASSTPLSLYVYSIYQNFGIYGTIYDLVVMMILIVLIFFRTKTIKH